jgi:hypothetical protein
MASYYRIHDANKTDGILDESTWTSRVWVGHRDRQCVACGGSGNITERAWDDEDEDNEVDCEACDGKGIVEDVRHGVSVCRTVADLAAYFDGRAPCFDGDVLVELDGRISDDDDHDAEASGSPLLLIPGYIVSIQPVPAALLALGL